MLQIIMALNVFIFIGVILLVWELIKRPKIKTTVTGIQTQAPNSIFRKPKRKPIALDDDAAYELEQKMKRGPQP